MTWTSDDIPESHRITPMGWLRVVLRGTLVALLTFGCLGLLLLVRLLERPLCGQGRPVTPYITQFVCRMAFVLMGIRYARVGAPMRGAGAVVANHSSWLDIFALNAAKRIYFVSKAEVAGWPGIGWLARATGTVFIARDRREAAAQVQVFRERLGHGHKLLFFPEGTSTDGQRVLPFKATLFAAFFDPALRDTLSIQPVSVVYHAPKGSDPRHYGWWGDMDFGPHLLATLAQSPQGGVTVVYHDPVKVADFADRKALAAALETTVRDGVLTRLDHHGNGENSKG
ncbi:MAG: 1-acyl-sn-glycerol-3-phosphate acyltransferase [Octadecabacter sp.]|nr:1-acyl-sn-glycerol-3-phosphate acyltransferase [Octadecabacter sp.]